MKSKNTRVFGGVPFPGVRCESGRREKWKNINMKIFLRYICIREMIREDFESCAIVLCLPFITEEVVKRTEKNVWSSSIKVEWEKERNLMLYGFCLVWTVYVFTENFIQHCAKFLKVFFHAFKSSRMQIIILLSDSSRWTSRFFFLPLFLARWNVLSKIFMLQAHRRKLYFISWILIFFFSGFMWR